MPSIRCALNVSATVARTALANTFGEPLRRGTSRPPQLLCSPASAFGVRSQLPKTVTINHDASA
jgi:hypothetical protein